MLFLRRSLYKAPCIVDLQSLLGLGVVGAGRRCTALSYCPASQASLVLEAQSTVDHATAAGRIAFCVPAAQLPDLQVDQALWRTVQVACTV